MGWLFLYWLISSDRPPRKWSKESQAGWAAVEASLRKFFASGAGNVVKAILLIGVAVIGCMVMRSVFEIDTGLFDFQHWPVIGGRK